MAIQKFEDAIAWQKAQDYAFKDQISRAAVSISNNIAEGFDRSSNAEFARFPFIALGSCIEVKSMLYLAERLQSISSLQKEKLLKQGEEVSKIIRGLIKSLTP